MTAIAQEIRIAVGDDFLMSFGELPKATQKKTRSLLDKFRSNPSSPGLNYEKINGAADANLRSLRVDRDYRVIIQKPEKGNTYILLWVDKHDSAYDWASGRVCSINPSTGAIQVLPVRTTEASPITPGTSEAPSPSPKKKTAKGLFDPFKDSELLELGIPEQSMEDVRAITSDSELDALEDTLPPDAFEALFYLALGSSLEETKRELGIELPSEVDTADFAAALDRESSKRKFVVISDAEEMEKILSYPLDRWRIFLHPSQKRIVRINAKGPVRVLGGAGTGKTVVAIHRAKWLAENVCNQNERILFTTFTKNLAADIENNLRKLCSHETLQKIEVINLDAWASRLLAGKGIKDSRVDFGSRTRDLWKEALTSVPPNCPLSEEDLEKEWRYVVQAQGVRDESSYIRASRIGMGRPLNRPLRKVIWPIFEEYISLLKEAGICEPIDALRMARELIEQQKLVLDYRCVIVDEAQDLSPEAFRLANAIVPPIRAAQGNNLFIVGDAHQRLYGYKIVLSHCGISIVGRSRKLRINYRTSEETRNWATSILRNCLIDDLDGGLDDQKGYRSLFHGEPPLIEPCSSDEEQIDVICGHISNLIDQGSPSSSICVVARSNAFVEQLSNAIKAKGVETRLISGQNPDNPSETGVRLATMHRVKGIEFDHMILANMDEISWRNRMDRDEESGVLTLPQGERCLVYVAATRARKSVLVTSAGTLLTELAKP